MSRQKTAQLPHDHQSSVFGKNNSDNRARERKGLLTIPTTNPAITVTAYANKSSCNGHDFITYGGLKKHEEVQALLTLFWNHDVTTYVSITKKEKEGQVHHLKAIASQQFGPFYIGELTKKESTNNYDVYQAIITYTNDTTRDREERTLTHIHYKTWRDNGPIHPNPDTAIKVMDEFTEIIAQYHSHQTPLAVNCNAGLCRTICLIKSYLAKLTYNDHNKINKLVLYHGLTLPFIDHMGNGQSQQLANYISALNDRLENNQNVPPKSLSTFQTDEKLSSDEEMFPPVKLPIQGFSTFLTDLDEPFYSLTELYSEEEYELLYGSTPNENNVRPTPLPISSPQGAGINPTVLPISGNGKRMNLEGSDRKQNAGVSVTDENQTEQQRNWALSVNAKTNDVTRITKT